MRKRILSWGLILSLLLTMLPVSAMAAEDELAGNGLSVTESTQCTCGAEPDADGVTVHQEGCPLYEAPVVEEPPEEDSCTCGAAADADGVIVHQEGCSLYEAPVVEAPPEEDGCTCGAIADADGVTVHQEGCPLYEAPTREEPPAEDGCTCGAEPDADGVAVHQEGCPLYEAPVVEEPPAEELPAEEPSLNVPGFAPMEEPALITTAEHGTHTGWTQLYSYNSTINGGNYYLNGNVTAYQAITINNDVILCLNGHTLDMGANTLTVSSGATLTICDCSTEKTGTITGKESYISLNVISVEGGTLNLESGTISGTTTGSGSLISVTDGELNVTGGTISLNHTGTGAYSGVQAVKLSNSTGSFTGGKVSLTTAVDNARATTVYQEGGTVTVGGSAEIVFEWTTTEEKPNSAPGYGALCVTQSGSVTVKDNCTITAFRTGDEMAGAVSIGTLNDATGTAIITGGDINGFLVVYGTAEISNGSFAYIENRGTLTMTGGTVKNENENGINYGIWTSVTNGKTDLSNVTIKSATGIYVSTGLGPTIGNGVTINATKYGVGGDNGSATLVGAPSISGGIADLYIYSMRTTTDYPSVNAMAYTGGALTVQERKFPDAHQGGYIGCAIKVKESDKDKFQFTNSDGNFVYQYDTENSALRLYNQNAHPICGASCDHEDASHNDPAWQQWTSSSGGTLDSGSYYLTSNVTLSQPIVVTGDVNLCLNGNTIKRSDGSNPFQVTDGGSLTICDCKDTGKLTGGITATGGQISIYGGTISGGAYAVDLGGNAKLTLAGSPALSGNTAALKLYTKSGTTLENAAVDATDYTGEPLNVEEDNVPGGANGFAIKGGENKFSLTNLSTGYHYAYEGGYVIRPDHTHSYTYSGSGAVITEECDCGHSATATISIQDGANLTYTGSAITPAQVTYSDNWQGGNLTPTYENNINAGAATAKIEKDNATASVTFTIGKANQTAPTASDYTIDYANEKIASIANGCKVYTSQTDGTEVQTGTTVTPGTTYYIRREGDANHNPSDFTAFTVASRPAAPSVTAAAETIKDKGDGKVTGVDTTMEYSTDSGQNWTACTGNEITGLAAGTTVTVRVKATGSAPHGKTASCTIGASTVTLTVTFEENGGSAVPDITGLSYHAAISAPDPTPTKTGYTFDGWYKEQTYTTKWNFDSDKVADNITLYAKWTPATYSISYDLNGGTVSGNPTSYTVETDSFTLNNPTRTGYTFAGWTGTDLSEATTSVTITQGSTGDRTYTATWTANTYTVAFNKNADDATGEMTAQTFAYGQKQALTANAFTRTGYTFAGWDTAADGSGAKYTDQQEVENLSATDGAAITLYAQWTANSNTAYTVKHWQQNLNDNTNYTLAATESLTGTTGASVTPGVKTYDGFTAPGTQTVTIAADGSTVVDYYYTRNSYTVTLGKGTGIASVTGAGTYQYGESVTISAEVSDGYVWSKWSDDHTDQERIFTMGAEDISLTAQATPISYTITYDLGGGTVSGNPASYTVETDSFTLESPTRTGYTFAGWTGTDITGTSSTVTIPNGSTGDRTYTATWTANTYTVAFDKNADDAAGEMTAQTFAYGQKQALTANTYTRTGYTFSGWNTEADGSGVKYTDQQEVENLSATDGATITLYAQWALEGLTVTITGVPEEPVTYGTEITLTAATTHTADGLTYTYQWYKGDAALSGKTGSTLTLTDVADSGSYTVEVTASDGSQSSMASSAPEKVAVRPLGIAVTWSGLTRVYGDTEPEVSAVLGGVLGNDACGLSAITYQQGDTSVAEPTNAGEYTAKVSLTGADAPNYTLKNGTATLTIRPKAVGFTVSGNAVKGDGTAKAATITPTDNTLAQTGYSVTYRQGTVTVAAPTAVGSYEIWVEITDGNYEHTNGKTEMQVGSLTITQASPVLYTATFVGGADAAGTAPNALSAVANAKIILPESNFTRTNYQFTGWAYGGKTYQPGDSFTMPARDVTFTAQWQQTYGITITVQEPKPEGEGTQTVSGAVVSLWLGANKLDERTTGNDGEYTFAELLPGIYNLVVTQGDRTVTTMVEITSYDVEETAALPKGATNSIVKVTPGSPDIVVGKLDTVFDKIDGVVYTQDDQDNVDAGGKVEFTFTADKKQMGDSSISDDVGKIEENKDTAVTVGLVMDYKLEKEAFDAEGTKIGEDTITQSNVLLEIRLPLPAELQGKAGYAVYRVHNDQAEAMKANPGSGEEGFKVEGSYITIYAQKFSTYAIGYTESSGNDNNNNQSSGGGGSSTPTYPLSIEEPEHGSVTISPRNPEKGDQVTITPTPDEGYTVDTVVVTNPSGKPVAVTPNDDGTYTFVQPAGNVTITVTFRKLTSVSDCPRDESCPMAPFTDADRNAWYHDGIHYCVEHGLMSGYGNGIFGPNKSLSRGMLVQILYNLEDRPATSGAEMFKDVPDSAWCFDAVNWAASVGIVGGYGNGMYRPDDSITREQLAAMLYRYAQYKEYDVSVGEGTNLLSYTDASRISEYAIPAMQWACGTGIIAGVTSSTLVPKGTATRAQVATMLMRFADKVAQ